LQAAEDAARLSTEIQQTVEQLHDKNEGVVSAVESVSAVVEENAAVAEEMAASSEQWSAQSEKLADTIAFLKTTKEEDEEYAQKTLEKEFTRLKEIMDSKKGQKIVYQSQEERDKHAQHTKNENKGFNLEMSDDDFEKFEE
jgi:hypothetical protein